MVPMHSGNRSWRWCALLLPLWLLASAAVSQAADTAVPAAPNMVPNPGADLWRAVRQRDGPGGGSTQVEGVQTGVLIAQSGEEFRTFRRQDLIGNAGLLIGTVAGLILLFFLIRGRIPIAGGRTGRRIHRFADVDRGLHWFTAGLFVFLALTGLTLLFGRFVVLPVFGPEAFGVIGSFSKEGHNIAAPLFPVAVILLFVRFAARNLPARGDITWLLKGGGMVGKGHVSAGYFNAGEKIWFWTVMVLGLTVSISGLILLFPNFGQGRELMQLALIVHGVAAVLFIAGSFGHIYIGTLGMEGSIESMTTGYVDENWAKAHHDRWYEQVKGEAVEPANGSAGGDRPSLHASTDKA